MVRMEVRKSRPGVADADGEAVNVVSLFYGSVNKPVIPLRYRVWETTFVR